MISRVEQLIQQFKLIPHPEGGWYRETYRSESKIDSKERDLCTSIYFLITDNNVSKFHRIKSDELWFFHEGTGLTIHVLDSDDGYKKIELGTEFSKNQCPFGLVFANQIFGSTVDVNNGYAFVSCVVSPGFDFKDFELFNSEELLSKYPDNEEIIQRLT